MRTDLPADAVKRAAALLAVYEQKEDQIVDAILNDTLTKEDAKALLTEVLRAELARLLQTQCEMTKANDAELDARVEELEAENKALKRAARQGNWDGVRNLLDAATKLIGISAPEPLDPDLGRQAISLKRRLTEIEVEVLEGDDLRQCAKPLLNETGIEDLDAFVQTPVLLSVAIARTFELWPSEDMKGNTQAIANLAMEFFGDVPVSTITRERQKAFFEWMARVPKINGKSHGKNRFNSNGRTLSKSFEISQADAKDAKITDGVRNRNDMSLAEKRAVLAEQLTPRLARATIERNQGGLNRIFSSARDLGAEAPEVLSRKDIWKHLEEKMPKDDLYVRVTKPKTRRPWSAERLASFFLSPIYTGAFSASRRARRGQIIVRDATYWVPLILLTLGTRIEETLLLKRKDVVLRNGLHCFNYNSSADQLGKTESSQRTLAIPQLLLELGFVEWFQSLPENHGIFLFPDAVKRASTRDVTSPFSKHLRRILSNLEIDDFHEDIYAARMTFTSMLNAAGVSEAQRQAIAGHSHGTVLNCHYTAHNVGDLKLAMDKADFQLEIRYSPKHGFPIIHGCSLKKQEALRVEVTLDENSEAETLQIFDTKSRQPLFEYHKGNVLNARDRREWASELLRKVGNAPLQMPQDTSRVAAIEHFMALGSTGQRNP
ncbi:tyrosine-type recombinase/integrase [Thioclava sp. ES.031]|uniref:tyrosine-type recombinase/integrase n=1 Tax=Thioclava sp. ES.031 TaxID=1798203 RepID=UPI000BF7B672|nr:tyrosine-type recombinase/integrase [Thioclava sp. ES.031]